MGEIEIPRRRLRGFGTGEREGEGERTKEEEEGRETRGRYSLMRRIKSLPNKCC